MRTTISLPDPVFENAKSYAQERHITLSVLIEDALRCRMAQKPAEPRKRFRLVTVAGKLVDPSMDLSKISEIIAADDEERFRDASGRR